MRLTILGCGLLYAVAAFGQADRGNITGTVSDPTGGVVPNASIEARNQGTAVVFRAATTNTGNYTLAQLPVGTYELSVSVSGFKKYLRPGVQVQVAETTRVDATLEVGATTDTITINEDAPLLKTESGELSHQIDYNHADELPIFTTNGTGGSSGLGNIRDPLSVVNLLPGAVQVTDNTLRLNGLPSSSQAIRVEGQDATNGMWKELNQANQQGVEAIQEVSIQTSNYAAEYGQAGGGYFNYTMKSGTNQFHGSAYDYFTNEFMNAGLPFTDNCTLNNNCGVVQNQGHIKNEVRRNDYGFTLGGPVIIPKVYNGKDKTFFFFNWEQFLQTNVTANQTATMPTSLYAQGDFSQASYLGIPVCSNACYANNTVFNPTTRTVSAGGAITEVPFALNKIPVSMMDPTALYLQSLFLQPTTTAVSVNNYVIPAYSNYRHTMIPSFKIDQSLTSKAKLSGYFADTHTVSPNASGFPLTLTQPTPTDDTAYTVRVNFDYTVTPTLLFHFGAGFIYYDHPQFTATSNFSAQAEAAAKNGFGGAPGGSTYSPFPAGQYMPSISGLNNAFTGGLALGSGFIAPGLGVSGLSANVDIKDIKPTANTSLTWVKGNHTYKAGAEMILEGFPTQSSLRAFGELAFSAQQTENPAESNLVNPFFTTGFPYASFLLGQTSNATSSAITDTRLGNHSWGIFLQDNWKVTHKLTLDYGLRWDYASLLTEQYGRMGSADFFTVNPTLASSLHPQGLPGSILYGATCHCNFNDNYPFAIGPRLGLAYQITPKTVFRAGAGLSYSTSPNNAFLSYSVANFYGVNARGFALPATQLSSGNPFIGANTLTFPNYNYGGQYPYPSGAVNCGPSGNEACVPPVEPFISIDKGTGRLPRIFSWSINLQREIAPNLVVEAAYVGNRGAWFSAPVLAAQNYNGLTPQGLLNTRAYGATQGIDLTNPNDGNLLTLPINNPQVIARFPLLANPDNVYPGFPSSSSLGQALRPYPQWFGVPPFLGPPLGDTWYDSLQVKLTKRYSHGLTVQAAYTWAKQLTNGANSDTSYFTPQDPLINNVYDTKSNKQLSGFDQPQVLVINFNYTTPKIRSFGGDGVGGKAMRAVVRDWTIGGVLKYASGMLIQTPPSGNNLLNQLQIGNTSNNGISAFGGGTTFENYVPGQSCLAVDPNSHFDPTKTLALNPNAWTEVGPGQYGASAPYYSNCRWQRQPSESINFGRIFRIKERYQLQIRAEFYNLFNRVIYSAPSVGSLGAITNSLSPGTTNNPFPNGLPGALNGGFGFVNTLNGAGTNPRSGQLVARFTF